MRQIGAMSRPVARPSSATRSSSSVKPTLLAPFSYTPGSLVSMNGKNDGTVRCSRGIMWHSDRAPCAAGRSCDRGTSTCRLDSRVVDRCPSAAASTTVSIRAACLSGNGRRARAQNRNASSAFRRTVVWCRSRFPCRRASASRRCGRVLTRITVMSPARFRSETSSIVLASVSACDRHSWLVVRSVLALASGTRPC